MKLIVTNVKISVKFWSAPSLKEHMSKKIGLVIDAAYMKKGRAFKPCLMSISRYKSFFFLTEKMEEKYKDIFGTFLGMEESLGWGNSSTMVDFIVHPLTNDSIASCVYVCVKENFEGQGPRNVLAKWHFSLMDG